MSLLWHEIVHDGEDSLFHLSCVLGSQNNHFSLVEVQGYTCVSSNIGDEFVGFELTSVKDIIVSSVGEVFIEFLRSWFYEHISHEESMIGSCTNDSDSDSLIFIITGIAIYNVNSLSRVKIVSCNII